MYEVARQAWRTSCLRVSGFRRGGGGEGGPHGGLVVDLPTGVSPPSGRDEGCDLRVQGFRAAGGGGACLYMVGQLSTCWKPGGMYWGVLRVAS